MASVPTSDSPLGLSSEQEKTVTGLSAAMKLVSLLLFLLALLRLAAGVAELKNQSGYGLLSVLEGLVTGFMGVVLLTAADDVRNVVDARKYAPAHLKNGLGALRTVYGTQLILGIILALVLLMRCFVST
jgi:hypothetical protein